MVQPMFAQSEAAPVSPPMSASSSSSSRSRRIGRPRISRRANRPSPVVRYDAKAGERSLDVLCWGLVPFWAKDLNVGFFNINANAEGIEGKLAFREAFQRRRCRRK
jgi:putative SOS response-associated peptidase YedK